MFCPNCGKDAGEFKFCPYCGTGMPELKAAVWSVGMPCPYCGGTKLEGKDCAFCGARLVQEETAADEDSFEIPYGVYGRRPTWLMLVDDHVTFTFEIRFKNQTITVPYSRITKIEYARPKEWQHGKMTISWEKARDVLLSPGLKSDLGTASIVVKDEDFDVFYHLCYVLKQLAPASAELVFKDQTDEDVGKDQTDDLTKIIDLDSYFREFDPYRKQAWEAVYERNRIHASKLIHAAFDQRQKELYEREPALAVRDLNRAIKEKKRQKEIREQERKEREAQRRARRR